MDRHFLQFSPNDLHGSSGTGQSITVAEPATGQQRFGMMVEQAPVAMALFSGPQFVITLANEQVLKLWGRTHEQVINKPLFEALPETSNQGFEDLLVGVYTTGERFVAKELSVTLERNGRLERPSMDFVYEAFRDADGTITGVLVACTEITEHIQQRQILNEAQATLQGAIDMANLGTWSIDLNTRILNYCQRARAWFGIGPDEIITVERAYQSIQEADRPRVRESILAATAPGSNGVYDLEYTTDPTQAGEERTLRAQGKTFFTPQGNAYKISGTIQDVTEQRQSQRVLSELVNERTRQLQTSMQELERSNENLERFAYVASHDLQEPLRKIQSFGKILTDQYSSDLGDGADLIRRMQLAATRMSTLITDLLALSHVSAQRATYQPISLNDIVSEVLTDLELRIQETGATLTINPLPTVMGDSSQLRQLFQNLLSNALKFRRPGIEPIIQLCHDTRDATDLPPSVHPAQASAAYYYVEVIDNGIGFDQQQADQIFQVFHRLHGRSEFSGSGVGLAICEKVAINHGGAITATGIPGEGATFTLYLPVNQL
ncbi:MAG: PAS domain S-box protein [Spirosoma sp.]|nr:PAS domain S-box protein [Spirosoma sp.]